MNKLSKYTLLSTVAAMILVGCGSGSTTNESTTQTETIGQTTGETIGQDPGEIIDQTPAAIAGEDQNSIEDNVVKLDGSKSSDDTKIINYEWSDNGDILSSKTTPYLEVDNLEVGEHTLTLTVTDEADQTDTDSIIVNVKPRAGWYGKTKVYATQEDTVYQHTTAGIFGVLKESSDTQDKNDIPGVGTAVLQVVFPQTNWEKEENGDYFSDYQSYGANKQAWTFQVKNQKEVDLSDATLKIELEGIYDVIYAEDNTASPEYLSLLKVNSDKRAKLTLLDIDNEQSYSVAELASAQLGMNGKHVRTFKWVMGEVDLNDYAVPGELLASDINTKNTLVSKMEAAEAEEMKSDSKFGRPPALR